MEFDDPIVLLAGLVFFIGCLLTIGLVEILGRWSKKRSSRIKMMRSGLQPMSRTQTRCPKDFTHKRF